MDEYLPVHADHRCAILLLHGSGASERDVMAPLAGHLAVGGVAVVVPDWDLSSDSLVDDLDAAFGAALARADGGSVVVAGWSAGGRAAWWLAARHPGETAGVAVLASRLTDIDGLDVVPSDRPAHVPVVAVTGSRDTVVPASAAQATVRGLRVSGVRVEHLVVDADHAGVIGTVYDPLAGRCWPSTDADVLAARDECARAVLRLAGPLDG